MRNRTLFDDETKNENIDEIAFECAEEILAIKPTVRLAPGAHRTYAKKLMEVCRESCEIENRQWTPTDQMRWAARTIREEFHDPPTAKELGEIILKKFQPELYRPANAAKPRGERPVVQCEHCTDNGYTYSLEHNRSRPYAWCSCDAACRLRAEDPNFVDFMNETSGHPQRLAIFRSPSLRFVGNRVICKSGPKTKGRRSRADAD